MNGIDEWYLYGLFGMFSTFSVYNGQRLIKSTHPTETPWLEWVNRNEKSLYLVTFASGLMTLSSLLLIGKLSLASIALLLGSGIVSLFYVIPVKGIIMREIPYIKVYLIAFTWAAVLIIFPILNEEKYHWTVWIHGLAHALFIISVAIPFDIRDVKFDQNSQKTIPQVVGVAWAKALSILLLFLFYGLMVIYGSLNPVGDFLLVIAVMLFLILNMNEKRGDVYCAGAIDGAIGLIGMSYFFAGMNLW